MDPIKFNLPNIYNYATEQARTIVFLHYFDMAICFVILSIVVGLVVYIAIKFRQRPDDANAVEPRQDPGDIRYELFWTLTPAFILIVLAILTAIVMHQVSPPVKGQQPDVIVNAHQWWWEYRYPKTGVVTANELYLPEGVNSLIEIRAADVVHSFWVPEFGEKIDAIPGHPNHVFYKPIKLGDFSGACSEFCGDDHALMRIMVKVVTPQEFQEWTAKQLKTPAAPTDETAQRGEKLFMSKTCIQCHNISDTAAKAHVGPDLTHLGGRQTIGSVLLPNNEENVAAWIFNAQKFKPGCFMPKMRVTQEEAHDIATYLESLK